MKIIRQRRKILGRENDNTGYRLPEGTKVIKSDPSKIDAINRELRKKCEKQRENDAAAMVASREMWVGGCYFETRPEDQMIYGGPVKVLKRK